MAVLEIVKGLASVHWEEVSILAHDPVVIAAGQVTTRQVRGGPAALPQSGTVALARLALANHGNKARTRAT